MSAASVADVHLLAISGSLRRGSVNTALLRAARELAGDGVEVTRYPLDDVPMFDADVEAAGLPAEVAALRAAAADADGLLLASPEYNWSVSGVLKNAIDWLSRPPEPPINGKPTALLSGAGGGGGKRSQQHLRDVLGHNEVDVLERSVQIAGAGDHVDDGRLVTDEHREEVGRLVAELAARVRERRG